MDLDRRRRLETRLTAGADRRRKERKDFDRSGVVPWSWETGGKFRPKPFWERHDLFHDEEPLECGLENPEVCDSCQ